MFIDPVRHIINICTKNISLGDEFDAPLSGFMHIYASKLTTERPACIRELVMDIIDFHPILVGSHSHFLCFEGSQGRARHRKAVRVRHPRQARNGRRIFVLLNIRVVFV